ncbi:MAG: class II fructose-bisphosphate aldolase, partial [Chloroflexota bacterium]|nr:class II fructose-bisphosphate aldolase [Chloroflexota bacterium]
AVFESALANKVGVFILEIAKSEIKYTAQRPAEYTTSVLAAAIKAGYKHPIYLQGDHFQINAKDYQEDPDKDKAREAIKQLIREAVEAGFYQIDLDMSVLVDWSKETADEQQENNFIETASLTAYVRALERELGLDKSGIVINLGGEIGEIGKGLEKGKERNSTPEDLQAFWQGYTTQLAQLSAAAGYEIIPITKIAIQTGTKHGGIRDSEGRVAKAKVSFNTIAELGKFAREKYGLAGVVQHGASTLDPRCFVVFAGKDAPQGFDIPQELLSNENKELLAVNPTAEVHLATAYQDTILDHPAFLPTLLAEIRAAILKQFPAKPGQEEQAAFVENRKNAWGSFKLHLWNLPLDIQQAIRSSLKQQFDTVFTNLGVNDSEALLRANQALIREKEQDATANTYPLHVTRFTQAEGSRVASEHNIKILFNK